MRPCLILIFAIVCSVSYSQRDSSMCVTGDGLDDRDMELSVGYFQFDHGYFYGDLTIAFDFAYGIGFYEPGIRLGYNPWYNGVFVETTQSLGIGLLSYDLHLGWAQNLDQQKGLFFLSPGISFSFKYFDLGYSYAFTFDRSMEGFNSGSNFNVKIPICSACAFTKFKEKKRWHWGEARHGVFYF